MLENGTGTLKDAEKAAMWYRKAADQGNSRAQNNLGNLLRDGNGVAQNPEEAKHWYELSAAQGNFLAQFNLGVLYFKGKGTDVSYLDAYKWLSLAMNGFRGQDAENYVKAAKSRDLLISYMTPSQIQAGEELVNKAKNR
jgi:hypothetical protein